MVVKLASASVRKGRGFILDSWFAAFWRLWILVFNVNRGGAGARGLLVEELFVLVLAALAYVVVTVENFSLGLFSLIIFSEIETYIFGVALLGDLSWVRLQRVLLNFTIRILKVGLAVLKVSLFQKLSQFLFFLLYQFHLVAKVIF